MRRASPTILMDECLYCALLHNDLIDLIGGSNDFLFSAARRKALICSLRTSLAAMYACR